MLKMLLLCYILDYHMLILVYVMTDYLMLIPISSYGIFVSIILMILYLSSCAC